jgi:hypothetical protein
VRCTSLAVEEVTLHRDDIFARKDIVNECDVFVSKAATVHRWQNPP